MSEAGVEMLLRERVRALADLLELETVEPFDPAPVVAKGVRQRRMHRASIGAALAAVIALIAVVGLRSAPTADRIPSFVTEPRPSAEPTSDVSPVATGEADASRRTEDRAPLPDPAPTRQWPLTTEVPGCLPAPPVEAPAGVDVTLTLDETIHARDGIIRMELTVRNAADHPVEYRRAGQRYDFWVQRDDGVIWTWSYGKRFGSVAAETSIAPGEQLHAAAAWDQSRCAAEAGSFLPGTEGFDGPPPGRYVARALWRTDVGGWWSNAVEFVVL